MRLNWTLKHTTSLDNKDIRPIGLEEYLNQWGIDLYLPYIAIQYCDILLLNNNTMIKDKTESLYKNLESRTTADNGIAATKRYNLWDGVNVTMHMDSKGSPLPKYKPNDKHLKVSFMKINRFSSSATIDKFELHISKERYTSIAPIEYYNYTKDYPSLD